jgi:3-oxoacyl-[acyl-carrier protein] reductase
MNYDLDFTGKTVLIVGGTSGIGNATAQGFRKNGAEVYVWGTRPSAADYSADDGSDLTGLHYQQMDVMDFDAIAAYEPPFARLDVLVTCQGGVAYKRAEFEMETFQRIVDINLNSVMACCLKFESMLEASGGNIVIVGSIAGFHSTFGNPAYAASKTGVVGLVRTLGEAWAKKIRVNSVAPGFVATKLTTATTSKPERLERAVAKIPVGRAAAPEEMAGPIMFLASPLASFMVGQSLCVDGGRLLE